MPQVYDRVAKRVSAISPRPWDFDVSSVFAHIDAFLQRCKDLMEVCEAQMQFAPKVPLPVFGGLRGAEVKKSILDIQVRFTPYPKSQASTKKSIFCFFHLLSCLVCLQNQASFQVLVAAMRSLTYDILDVKATQWHDDFNTFKTGTKDLEVMMTNVIQFAFDAVSSLSNRIELLEVSITKFHVYLSSVDTSIYISTQWLLQRFLSSWRRENQ